LVRATSSSHTPARTDGSDISNWNEGDDVMVSDGDDRMVNKQTQDHVDVDETDPPEEKNDEDWSV
jgi:hypothetical protein